MATIRPTAVVTNAASAFYESIRGSRARIKKNGGRVDRPRPWQRAREKIAEKRKEKAEKKEAPLLQTTFVDRPISQEIYGATIESIEFEEPRKVGKGDFDGLVRRLRDERT